MLGPSKLRQIYLIALILVSPPLQRFKVHIPWVSLTYTA